MLYTLLLLTALMPPVPGFPVEPEPMEREFPPRVDVDEYAEIPNVYIRYRTPSGALIIEAVKLNGVAVKKDMVVIDR